MDKIYIVTEEWMNEGEGGCTPHPFTTYEKAKAFYDRLIEKEKTEYMAANAYASDDVDETEDGTDLHSSRTEKERAYSDEDHSRNDINREESE